MHVMVFWQLQAAVDGYRDRNAERWLPIRWQTWALLSALGAEIDSPERLLPLPQDKRRGAAEEQPTDEEIQQLQQLMRQMNNQGEE